MLGSATTIEQERKARLETAILLQMMKELDAREGLKAETTEDLIERSGLRDRIKVVDSTESWPIEGLGESRIPGLVESTFGKSPYGKKAYDSEGSEPFQSPPKARYNEDQGLSRSKRTQATVERAALDTSVLSAGDVSTRSATTKPLFSPTAKR